MIGLTVEQEARARRVGVERQRAAEAYGARSRFGPRERAWQLRNNDDAAGAELAWCLTNPGSTWEAERDGLAAVCDVRLEHGTPTHVRSTVYDDGFLAVYPHDRDHDVAGWFVLVTGQLSCYIIAGIIRVEAAMTDDHWQNMNPKTDRPLMHPCWVVQQCDLTSHWAMPDC